MEKSFTPPPGQNKPDDLPPIPQPPSGLETTESKPSLWAPIIGMAIGALFIAGMGFFVYSSYNNSRYGNWHGPYPLAESTAVSWNLYDLRPVGQTRTCYIADHTRDGQLSVVGVGEEHLLLRYETPRGQEELDRNECPDGTQAVVSIATYNGWIHGMERLWERQAANAEAERARLAEERELRRAEQQLTR